MGHKRKSTQSIFLPLFFLNVICSPLILAGCTSAKVADAAPCAQADWYELGRTDGSQGAPTDRLFQHRKSCAKNYNSEWETMYTNGRNAGLVEFCDPKNAYELGRMGVSYYYVCPSTVESPFLAAYRRGQQARDIELQNQKLDEQIDELGQKLMQVNSTYEQKELSSQLDQLKNLRAKNERELSKIIAK